MTMKACPRCGCKFECRNDDIITCDCIWVPLNSAQLQYIGQQYHDCLCADCLKSLGEEYNKEKEKQTNPIF